MIDKDDKRRWSGAVWVVALVLFVIVIAIFGLYGTQLGGVSSEPDDWGSFGSLLSGVFTLVAAVAASAAFFLTNTQVARLESLQREQEQSLVFDRYVKHRSLFLERCKEIELALAGRVQFFDVAGLYRRLFPSNSPTKCAFLLAEEERVELSAWNQTWLKTQEMLRSRKLPPDCRFTDPVFNTLRLAGHMCVSHHAVSDISAFKFTEGGEDFGFGVYDLCQFHSDLRHILNELAIFVGEHDEFRGAELDVVGVVSWLRDCFSSSPRDPGIQIKDQTKALVELQSIFDMAEARHGREHYTNELLGVVVSNLRKAFRGNEQLQSYLLSKSALDDLDALRGLFGQARVSLYEKHLKEFNRGFNVRSHR